MLFKPPTPILLLPPWTPYNKVTITNTAYSLKTSTHKITGPFINCIDVTTTFEIYSQHVCINKNTGAILLL